MDEEALKWFRNADLLTGRVRTLEAQNKVLREGLEEIALKQVAFADFPTSLLELKTTLAKETLAKATALSQPTEGEANG